MRAFLTGGTGFIGGHVARGLVARDYEVTALARVPSKATALNARGVRVVPGDITEPATLRAMEGHDVVFHLAAWYALGVRDAALIRRINVDGTTNVLQAAGNAQIPRIVHCSTIAALGRAAGSRGIADETTVHPGIYGSLYERTKYEAHVYARASGLPVVIAMPGATYGPGDHSLVGVMLKVYAKRLLPLCPFSGTGLSWVHVEDVAAGIIAAGEKGTLGEAYVIGGDNETIGGVFRRIAPLTRIRVPLPLPDVLVRAATPASPLIARALGQQPNLLSEGLASMGGSWMFSSAKAERELGYRYRPVEEGVVGTVAALRAR